MLGKILSLLITVITLVLKRRPRGRHSLGTRAVTSVRRRVK